MSIHIGAQKGDVAKTILLPGDPLRAKWIAETFFENPVCFNNVRGMLGYTGTYQGKRVSVMGTGMGVPSISIYAHELITQFGVKNLIRVGSAGSYQKHIKIRAFNDKQKRESFEKQKGICSECKEEFQIGEMEADHITPWHEGGKTSAENCQMLCKEDNRRKSGK